MPGVILTDITRTLTLEEKKSYGLAKEDGSPSDNPKFKNAAQGAATTVLACVAPELENRGGLYLNDCKIADVTNVKEVMEKMRDFPDLVADYAVDEAAADRLWEISKKAVAK